MARPRGPNARQERKLRADGYSTVAGLDEVGRGAWAGPVSVGVVVYQPERRPPVGVRDSKQLTEERREALYPLITRWCLDWAVGHSSPSECDDLGMTAALRLAARRALAGLRTPPDLVLMDGNHDYVTEPIPAEPTGAEPVEVRTVVRGDAACISIAAASVVAKVTRDRYMRKLAPTYPGFEFHRNKGYPSPTHQQALAGSGLTSVHRRSWSYVDRLAIG